MSVPKAYLVFAKGVQRLPCSIRGAEGFDLSNKFFASQKGNELLTVTKRVENYFGQAKGARRHNRQGTFEPEAIVPEGSQFINKVSSGRVSAN